MAAFARDGSSDCKGMQDADGLSAPQAGCLAGPKRIKCASAGHTGILPKASRLPPNRGEPRGSVIAARKRHGLIIRAQCAEETQRGTDPLVRSIAGRRARCSCVANQRVAFLPHAVEDSDPVNFTTTHKLAASQNQRADVE